MSQYDMLKIWGVNKITNVTDKIIAKAIKKMINAYKKNVDNETNKKLNIFLRTGKIGGRRNNIVFDDNDRLIIFANTDGIYGLPEGIIDQATLDQFSDFDYTQLEVIKTHDYGFNFPIRDYLFGIRIN